MSKSKEFSQNTIKNLGYYVYIYSNPDTKQPFYIGKGKGNRCFNHLFQDNDSEKVAKIQEIIKNGKEPIIEILVHGVDEETALKVEAAAIDLIGIDKLTNVHKGHHASTYGRVDVDELNARYNQKNLNLEDITDDVIMIRINTTYYNGISDFDLYEMTRCCWKVNLNQASKAKYAFSIYDGMIMEVYEIKAWFPAYSTMHNFKQLEETVEKDVGRYEFIGNVAPEEIRKKYVGCMVSSVFSKGNQNPIKYILHD